MKKRPHKAYSYVSIMECPVCNQTIPSDDFMLHSMMQHPQFFAVWATFAMPTIAPNFEMLLDHTDELWADDAEETYEALLELCDQIGYHKVGVKNIDDAAPITTQEPPKDWLCPICIEPAQMCQTIRCIRACSHIFCSDCICEWFKENKSCPVCKQRAEPEMAHVSAMDDVD